MRITDTMTNHVFRPVGFELGVPAVSWKTEEAEGKKQTAARVVAAEDPAFASVCFDTGMSETLSGLAVPLTFELKPYQRYYWRAEVISDIGERAVSETDYFETGKLDEAWEAEWIMPEIKDTENPVFEKELILEKDAPEARIYICGLGLYELYVNGERLGDEYLAPGCTHYDAWVQYQTYPVSFRAGVNRISVSLGNGWYQGRFGMHGNKSIYGDGFKLIAEIREHGELLCATDETWKVYEGDIRSNSIYDGEAYVPGSGNRKPGKAQKAAPPKGKLKARLSLPVRIHEERKPVEVLQTPAGETVLDMGQNMVGMLRMTVEEPAGTEVLLQFGEILQNGNFYNENLRSAKAEYRYISDGQKRTVCQHFTWYGFRYVKIQGIREVKAENFTGCVLFSDLKETGHIRTGNEKVNQLFRNILWGQRGNYLEIPTDCPQRDERLGWTGDTQVFSGTACFNMDSCAFLSKHMADVDETQRDLGYMTGIIPPFDSREATSAGWGDVSTVVPWTLYQYYGDKELLRKQYPVMKFWTDYICSLDENSGNTRLWKAEEGFGDWLARDHDNPKERYAGGTDLTYLHSAYYCYSAELTAKAAGILGYTADEAYYGRRAQEVRRAFQREFFTETGRLAVTTQTAYAIALFMELCPENAVTKTAEALAEKLKNGGGYLKTGFLGTPILCPVLSEHGFSEAAYTLLLNEETPSWLYAVNLGATTVWERWDSLLPDGTFNGTDMNSLNHYAYGAVAEWMYRYMAGLRQTAPGFKQVLIRPEVDERVGSADCCYHSAAGTYRVYWKLEKHEMEVQVTVPFDAHAVLYLPGKNGAPEELDAGTYTYHYKPDIPLWKICNTRSSFLELREYKPAQPLLERYMPGYQDIPAVFCKDSLRNLSKLPFFSITEEQMDEIDRALNG